MPCKPSFRSFDKHNSSHVEMDLGFPKELRSHNYLQRCCGLLSVRPEAPCPKQWAFELVKTWWLPAIRFLRFLGLWGFYLVQWQFPFKPLKVILLAGELRASQKLSALYLPNSWKTACDWVLLDFEAFNPRVGRASMALPVLQLLILSPAYALSTTVDLCRPQNVKGVPKEGGHHSKIDRDTVGI